MGFLDKVKEQGSALASKAQSGISQGQAKLDEAQAKKRSHELLAELGAWEWAARHGRDGGQATEQLERVNAALAEHEAEHGEIAAPQVAVAEPEPVVPPVQEGAEVPPAPPMPPTPPAADVAPPPPPTGAPVPSAPPVAPPPAE